MVPDSIMLDTFTDSLSEYEGGVLRDAINCSQPFNDVLKTKLVGLDLVAEIFLHVKTLKMFLFMLQNMSSK